MHLVNKKASIPAPLTIPCPSTSFHMYSSLIDEVMPVDVIPAVDVTPGNDITLLMTAPLPLCYAQFHRSTSLTDKFKSHCHFQTDNITPSLSN